MSHERKSEMAALLTWASQVSISSSYGEHTDRRLHVNVILTWAVFPLHKAEAVALPIQNLHSVSRLVEEHKKHRVKHLDFDIQLDQGS